MNSNISFAIFPYLKTTNPVTYKDLIFRNGDDISVLSEKAVKQLTILSRMFFLRDHQLLKNITYAVIPGSSEDEMGEKELLVQLKEFQILLAYLYSSPHLILNDPFLVKEHTSLFICVPKRIPFFLIKETNNVEIVSPDEYPSPTLTGDVDGYEVVLNFRSHLWVTKGSRIYPPVGRIAINHTQNLYDDLKSQAHKSSMIQLITFIKSKPERSNLSYRILTALAWYNRSNSMDIDEDVALVYLAIAFESLLNLEQGEKVTTRFREAVSLLLGGLPRLESWLTQFYDARSEIVHKGISVNLMFLATDDPKKNKPDQTLIYRSLVSVGRQIFRLCLSTITHGASMADELNLSSMFVTNQQRLEEICKIMSQDNITLAEKLQLAASHIRDIKKYFFIEERGLRIETLISASQLTVKTYLETSPSLNAYLLGLLNDFAIIKKSSDYYNALAKLQEINSINKTKENGESLINSNEVFLLLDCIWDYTFMHYYWLQETKERTSSDHAQDD